MTSQTRFLGISCHECCIFKTAFMQPRDESILKICYCESSQVLLKKLAGTPTKKRQERNCSLLYCLIDTCEVGWKQSDTCTPLLFITGEPESLTMRWTLSPNDHRNFNQPLDATIEPSLQCCKCLYCWAQSSGRPVLLFPYLPFMSREGESRSWNIIDWVHINLIAVFKLWSVRSPWRILSGPWVDWQN